MTLLAAEITAVTGRDPGEHYTRLSVELGTPYYTRVDQPPRRRKRRPSKALAGLGSGGHARR